MADVELISALAVLKANSEVSKDYIDNFVPFVIEAIRKIGAEVVSANDVWKSIYNSFNFSIPIGVIHTILGRMIDNGLLIKEGNTCKADKRILTDNTFQRRLDEITRNQNKLFSKYKNFVEKNNLPIHACDQLENCFYKFITSNMLDILIKNDQDKIVTAIQCAEAEKIYYSVSSFIKDITENDQELYTILEDIVKGGMIVNCLFYSKPNETKRLFNRTIVFLDTKIILSLAGFASKELRAPFVEICKLIPKVKATPACFEHTVDEASNILYFSMKEIENPTQKNPVGALAYFISKGFSPSDINLERGRLKDRIRAANVRIERKPPYTAAHSLDEQKLEEFIENEVKYKKDKARQFDVDSISATFRKRKGVFNNAIEDCMAIFVTTNTDFSNGVRKYFQEDYQTASSPHNICMSFGRFSTIIWSKLPQSAPDLPKKLIISTCYAALKPSEELWEKFVNEIEKLHKDDKINDSDYYYLRFSPASSDVLAETAAGDVSKITTGSIYDILEKAKQKEFQKLSKEIENKTSLISDANKRDRKRSKTISSLASKVSFLVISFIYFLYTMTIGIAAYYSFPKKFDGFSITSEHIVLASAVFVWILSNILLLFSRDTQSFFSKLKSKISVAIANKICTWLDL